MSRAYGTVSAWVCLATCGVGPTAMGQGTLLYDVDFSSPLHTVGQPPTLGLGAIPRRTPSGLLATPRVVESIGPLLEQPVELSPIPSSTSEFVRFSLDSVGSFPAYQVDFDLAITVPGRPFGGGFTLFADVPTVRPIRWRSEGTIQGPDSPPSAAWEVGVLQQVSTRWNLQTDRVTLEINGQFVDEFPFQATEIVAFRFAVGNNPGEEGPVTVAGVDNVRIWGVPGPWSAAPVAAVLVLLRRRR